jgi:hypothetical protein
MIRRLIRRYARKIPAKAWPIRFLVAALWGSIDLYGPIGGSSMFARVFSQMVVTSYKEKLHGGKKSDVSRMRQRRNY